MQHGHQFDIINTNPEDLPIIYRLFDQAIEYQKINNYPVWPDYDRKVLQEDIDCDRQFKLISEEEIACIFSICGSDPVVWREMNKVPALYLHRVVTNPKFKGQRLFQSVLDHAIELAGSNNVKLIRLDTWAHNEPIKSYYLSFGFDIVEYFTTPDTDELPLQQRGNDVVLMEYRL